MTKIEQLVSSAMKTAGFDLPEYGDSEFAYAWKVKLFLDATTEAYQLLYGGRVILPASTGIILPGNIIISSAPLDEDDSDGATN